MLRPRRSLIASSLIGCHFSRTTVRSSFTSLLGVPSVRNLSDSRAAASAAATTEPGTTTTTDAPLTIKNVPGNYKIETYLSKINDPWANLAFEEWLFRNSDPETYILFMYRNSKSVIIGRNQNPWKECNLKLLEQDSIPFVRRKSGGGTVYHYLKVDKTSLESKGTPSVRSPVTRLRESSFTIDHLSFCEAVRTEFLKRYGYEQWRQNMEGEPVIVDEAMIEGNENVKAIRDDMKTWAWMYGQSPQFTYRLEKAFPWGSVNVLITSKEGLITQVDMDSIDHSTNAQRLPLTALAVGLEGQRYERNALDLAIERIREEAPEVLSPKGAVEEIRDVARWLKDEI
ncbi:Biotin/lipoate A/B protein ligase [Modicella reniformis]|uniref:Putative lipoate-protein ligase A n=1 Tax=Modicella reniformis TaxID=1440133 RepID=A0A9P6MHJ9_9FUNG|nr:Biotin/lipoate A/B protein ligase [Modicella reniformis]